MASAASPHGASAGASPRRYEPRCAEANLVRRIVEEELDGFLAEAEARGHNVPGFVARTLRDFVTCGPASSGFVRVRCDDCGRDRVVPFACKRRGVCSSCAGRRMSQTAADLADRILPGVGVRQWVLSMPFDLRYRLAYDRSMMTPVLGAFVRAVSASLRRRARELLGVHDGRCGAVTFIQRFGGALNLNVHFHTLFLDGVYEVLPRSRGLRFRPLPPPDADAVARILADVARRLVRALEARGLRARGAADNDDAEGQDSLAATEPWLAALYAAAVQGLTATGPAAGGPVARLGRNARHRRGEPGEKESPTAAAVLGGLSLHAGVFIPATDRGGLEKLCRYAGRPALATARLESTADGRVLYRLRRPWRDGTTAIVMERRELVARLAAQVPPPRAHQVRYHGILAPSAQWRSYVVPDADEDSAGASPTACDHTRMPRQRRLAWSELLRRVFAIDVLECDRCGGRMRVVAAGQVPAMASALLASVVQAGRPPPAAA